MTALHTYFYIDLHSPTPYKPQNRASKVAARKTDTQPSAPHHIDNLKTKVPNTTGSNHLYNTLELLTMGIMVSETC